MEIHKTERNLYERVKIIGRHFLGAVAAVGICIAPAVPDEELVQNSDQVLEIDENFMVATANVHSWQALDGTSNIPDFLHFLEQKQPDVVCGQEAILSDEFPTEEVAEEGYTLLTAPTRLIPFVDDGAYGNFLLSKYRIENYKVHDLPMDISFNDPQKLLRPRKFIHAQLAREGGEPLDVIAFHLEGKGDDDVEQLQYILGYVALHLTDKPVVLCGDANNAAIYRDIAGASQVPEDTPFLATFPLPAPRLALDVIRVLNSETWSVDGYTVYDGGSDHAFLLATVRQYATTS